ncbi:MAG: gspD, partial [Verrucomicrobiales bacterium]|nr:gspD [Verrucomicrobiales bacterium]
MKTIVSLLLVLCLVSCSQPKPPPRPEAKYAPIDLDTEPPVAAATGQPAASVTQSKTEVTSTSKSMTAPMPGDNTPSATEPMNPATVTTKTVVTSNSVTHTAVPMAAPAPGNSTTPSPFGRPPQPAIPASGSPNTVTTTPSGTPVPTMSSNFQPEPLLPELSVNFHAVPIDLVLQTYADYVHRTLLRSPNINAQTTITLVQQNPLTKTELVQAFDAVLAMNGVAMLPIGEKFIKVVPLADVPGSGMKISEMNASMLPEFGPFDTHIVQLKFTKPSEMVPILQQFTKTPAAVLPIEGSGMLVLRDTAENVRAMLDMINRLDTAMPTEIESEVIPIKYALASDIANALNSISGSGGGSTFGGSSSGRTGSLGTSRTTGPGNGRGTGGGIGGGYNGQNSTQGGLSSGGGIGSGGGSLGGASSANPSFTDRVKSLIARADTGGKGGEFQILGQTKIIADERMNALLVFAAHDDMERIKKVVKQLDTVLAQVLIEAIIMEVTLDNSRTIGVSASQSPMGLNNPTAGGFNNGQQFFPFSGSASSNSFPGNFTSALPGNMFSYWANF